jgi:hypothetical protein
MNDSIEWIEQIPDAGFRILNENIFYPIKDEIFDSYPVSDIQYRFAPLIKALTRSPDDFGPSFANKIEEPFDNAHRRLRKTDTYDIRKNGPRPATAIFVP